MVEHAATLPPAERAGTLVRGCTPCGRPWDALLAADRADTGAPVDVEEVWRIVEACGGVCSKTAATTFRSLLAELGPGMLTSRPWRALAKECADDLHVTPAAERFASAAWYALATIGDRLPAIRAALPPADAPRLDRALAAMILSLPPLSVAGTGFVVPGGGEGSGVPWLQITVDAAAVHVGRIPFAELTPVGLRVTSSDPYPGARVTLGELAARVEAELVATAPPPPAVPGRLDEPVIIAPRAAPARLVLAPVAALGANRARLAVAAAAPAAMWRGLVAAHPMALVARAPAAPRVRFGLVSERVAVVDTRGRVVASAPLPEAGRPLVQRWRLAALELVRDRAVEVVAEAGQVDALAGLLDAVAASGATVVAPAAAPAPLTGGKALPVFDAAALRAAIAADLEP
jgi:hypothetical protein